MSYRDLMRNVPRRLDEELDYNWEPKPDSYSDSAPTMFPWNDGAKRLGRKDVGALKKRYEDDRANGTGSLASVGDASDHFDIEWQRFQSDLSKLCKRFWKRTGWIKGYDIPAMMNRELLNQAKRWERPNISESVSNQPETLKEDYESETCDWCDAGGEEMRDICDWIEDLVDYDDLEWREQQAIDGLCEEGGYVCKKCAKKLINRALRGVEERETGYTEPEFDEMSVDDKGDNPEGWEMPETFQDDNALPEDF